jgi:hypothetical protein
MQNSHFFVHCSYSLPDVSAVRIARELWCTSQESSPVDVIITMALHVHVSPYVPTNVVPFRGSETQSHPINMINRSIMTRLCICIHILIFNRFYCTLKVL